MCKKSTKYSSSKQEGKNDNNKNNKLDCRKPYRNDVINFFTPLVSRHRTNQFCAPLCVFSSSIRSSHGYPGESMTLAVGGQASTTATTTAAATLVTAVLLLLRRWWLLWRRHGAVQRRSFRIADLHQHAAGCVGIEV